MCGYQCIDLLRGAFVYSHRDCDVQGVKEALPLQFIQFRDEAVHLPLIFGSRVGPCSPLTPLAGWWGFAEECETITWFVIHRLFSVLGTGIIGSCKIVPMGQVRVMIVDDIIGHRLCMLI